MMIVVVAVAGCASESATGGQSDSADQELEPVPAVEADQGTGESCVVYYSPETLRDRAFAFDGTVVELRSERDPRAPGSDPAGAVFRVHEWFAGGEGDTAEVWMQRDVVVGERLLVAGEPRWGGDPLEDAIAAECGFTTPHSESRAAEWSGAFDEVQPDAATGDSTD